MEKIIRNSIKNRETITFQCRGQDRVGHPHAYGETKERKLIVKVYQIEGESNSGSIPDWRTFFLHEISLLQVSNTSAWTPQPDYRRGDKSIHKIYEQV